MFIPAVHKEEDVAALASLIRDNPLGALTTAIDSSKQRRLQCSHIPWVLELEPEPEPSPSAGPAKSLGKLRGHLARVNPQSRALIEVARAKAEATHGDSTAPVELDDEVLVVFKDDRHSYVTPTWYTHTKPETGKVVPTWNYAAAQVYGKITVYHSSTDPASKAFLRQHLADLSDQEERRAGYVEEPWKLEDAPDSYLDVQQRAIIGIEVDVAQLEGKYKMSQEKPAADIDGVISGFQAQGTEAGQRMADLIAKRRPCPHAR
ncbi:unnamed protein product [Parajaminaea phylloscopi]